VGTIRVLGDCLINRIAAGEVVERPASVVKELVENSLDAGARSIEVTLRAGGRESIRVVDDGCGMDRDDALLAVERHATSKLAEAEDLERISTLGFRGEALASIAAVSQLLLRTSNGPQSGTEIEIHGGSIVDVRDVGAPRGTTLQVDRLFFNTPARRKFLRRESTELSHAVRWLTRYALVHPEFRFLLSHGERLVLDAQPAGSRLDRIAQIHGRAFADKLLPFELELDGIVARGYAGRPVDGLPRRDAQYFFVNGRAVQDRVLSHAVGQSYANTMPRGRFPAVFLFLEIPPDVVDVNVHPQKTEVRFRESSTIHALVGRAVAAGLAQRGAVPRLADLRPSERPELVGVREAAQSYIARHPEPTPSGGGERPAAARVEVSAPAPAREPRAVPLAQLHESYIVAEDEQGLLLVDQHAAHERVLFERYLAAAEADQVETQRLLFPVTLELTPAEEAIVAGELDELRRLGFLVEPFGPGTVRLEGVPAVAAEVDPEGLFRELLGEAGHARSTTADTQALRHKLVTSAACQAAIKIHHPLATEQMQRLLDDLYETVNPTTCPHGRPSIFRLSLEEIERAFRRR